MTQNAALAAILTATRTDALFLDSGASIDWSQDTTNDSGEAAISFDVTDTDGNAVAVDMTREELTELVHRLAARLLA